MEKNEKTDNKSENNTLHTYTKENTYVLIMLFYYNKVKFENLVLRSIIIDVYYDRPTKRNL